MKLSYAAFIISISDIHMMLQRAVVDRILRLSETITYVAPESPISITTSYLLFGSDQRALRNPNLVEAHTLTGSHSLGLGNGNSPLPLNTNPSP